MRVSESRSIVLPISDQITVTSIGREGEWLQLLGLNDIICHGTNDVVAFSVASAWAGYLVVDVDWGDDVALKHGANVAEFSSTNIIHVYDTPGAYNVTAKATVRRLNADRTGWETTSSQNFVKEVRVRDDCIADFILSITNDSAAASGWSATAPFVTSVLSAIMTLLL